MPTTYVAPKAANGVQPRADLHDDTVFAEFDIAAAVASAANGGGGAGGTGFVVNDVVQMIKVQKGMKVVGVTLSVDGLDSSTGIVVAVGDGDDDDRFITASTIGRSSTMGVANLNNHAGLGYEYTVDDTIDFKVTTVASGTAATTGKIRLAVRFSPQQ